MADGNKRATALDALRAGTTIVADGGQSVGESQAPQAGNERVERKRGRAGSDTGTGASFAPGTGASDPAKLFGAKTADDYAGLVKPKFGIHPKTGEQVEIDYSVDGANEQAPFGFLPDGTPRQKRPRKAKGISAGTSGAAKSDASMSVLADAIFFAHTAIASVTKHSHWQQSREESAQYADALTDLQAAYGFDIDPKQAAWMKALVVIAMPTSMRVMASMSVSRREKLRPAPQPQPQAERPAPQRPQTDFNSPGSKSQLSPSQLFNSAGAGFTDDNGS